ncbi:copper chaperone PCu(A)C [Oricola cellulosilytica]|uniref:Copper chaperone PCu(A)C n=1 Tax=Oricola cellulosilytica TaxID=1429082 RepID=A0A4V2MNS5_9HYPH|nr:copper chaperone PCu(A)C [Oricola cellulosilytica]TCD14347.1 copper chaperone PCu(A)C [Oricola cellulosilytica]
MNSFFRNTVSALLISVLAVSVAGADDFAVGDLTIEHPYSRATPPNAPVSGGYLTIRNLGGETDRLLGGEAAFAGKVEIHEMTMDGDVMKMRKLDDGIEIPAGGSIELKPGGHHLMFMQLREPMRAGESRTATLLFERAGKIEVEFGVEEFGAGQKGHRSGN